MIREVFIDDKQIDIENDNAVGYIFTSPIFRDITKILSNRTTTYKIPKTTLNYTVIGLSDNADVISDFPYKEHTIKEYRDGLLFISGICTMLAISDTDIELAVIWGNTINLLSLRDLNLRDLKGGQYIDWNEQSAFMLSSSTDPYGFIAVDFGRGLSDFRYIHPSITIQGVLDMITQSQGVTFVYKGPFNEVFNKTWIPLLDKNANSITWQDYTVDTHFAGYDHTATNINLIKIATLDNKHNIIDNDSLRWNKDGNISIVYNIELSDRAPKRLSDGSYCPVLIALDVNYYGGDLKHGFDRIYKTVEADTEGRYCDVLEAVIELDTSIYERVFVNPSFAYYDDTLLSKLSDPVISSFGFHAVVKQSQVQFGDKYPIIANAGIKNTYALLKLYNKDGTTNNLKPRLLTINEYKLNDGNKYISAYFDEKQKFDGAKGLLHEYYSKFQLVLNRPVVVTTYVYLHNYELVNFKERYPVYINGVYYMPVEVTVQTNGLATCNLIKMPLDTTAV